MFNAYREIFLLPRPVWMLFWAGVINRAGQMVLPFLAIYSNKVLGLSVAEASIVVTAYGIGALVSGIVAGWLCDRFGAIHILIGSLLVGACLHASLAFIYQPVVFGAAAFLLAVVCESFRPALLTLASEYGPPHMQRQTFALVRLSVNLGMSIGPALGGIVFVYSPILLFWCNAIASTTAGLLLWLSLRRGIFAAKVPQTAEHRISLWKSLHIAYSDRRLVFLLLAMCPAVIIMFQHESTLPLILVKDLGLSEVDYGRMFTVNTALIVLFEIVLISKTARFGAGAVIASGALLTGIGFALTAWVTTSIDVMLTTVVWTLGEMLMFPVAVTYISLISTPKTRGSFMAAFGMMVSLCLVLAPFLGTAAWQAFGLPGYAWFCLVSGGITAALLWRMR